MTVRWSTRGTHTRSEGNMNSEGRQHSKASFFKELSYYEWKSYGKDKLLSYRKLLQHHLIFVLVPPNGKGSASHTREDVPHCHMEMAAVLPPLLHWGQSRNFKAQSSQDMQGMWLILSYVFRAMSMSEPCFVLASTCSQWGLPHHPFLLSSRKQAVSYSALFAIPSSYKEESVWYRGLTATQGR